MHRLSLLLTNKLCAEQIIDPDDKELYLYGFEITIANMINFLIMLSIGLLGDALIEICSFYVVFISTRRLAGGYHADSYKKCFSLFALTNLSVLLFTKVFLYYGKIRRPFLFGAIVFFAWMVYKNAPVEHENRPFTKEEAVCFRKKSLQITFFWIITGILLWGMGFEKISAGFIGAFIAVSVYMVVERRNRPV